MIFRNALREQQTVHNRQNGATGLEKFSDLNLRTNDVNGFLATNHADVDTHQSHQAKLVYINNSPNQGVQYQGDISTDSEQSSDEIWNDDKNDNQNFK